MLYKQNEAGGVVTGGGYIRLPVKTKYKVNCTTKGLITCIEQETSKIIYYFNS